MSTDKTYPHRKVLTQEGITLTDLPKAIQEDIAVFDEQCETFEKSDPQTTKAQTALTKFSEAIAADVYGYLEELDEVEAEKKRKADEAEAEEKRKADEIAAEEKRKADEAAAAAEAEEKRKADEIAAEEKRKADEAAAAAEAEEKRKADEIAAEAEKQRLADEAATAEAEKQRLATEAAAAEEKKKNDTNYSIFNYGN